MEILLGATPTAVLTVRQLSGQQILIEDTRPKRPQQQVMLEARQPWPIWPVMASSRSRTYRSDSSPAGLGLSRRYGLRRQLDDLVAKRLMLSEDDHYLGLATRDELNSEVSEEW